MKFPVYCIISDRIAVKAVSTEDGGLEVLEYNPQSDEFRRNMRFLDYIFLPTPTKAFDTEFVSKKEFDAYVAKLRKQTKVKRVISSITRLLRKPKKKMYSSNDPQGESHKAPEKR
jgi:hypothetical protein